MSTVDKLSDNRSYTRMSRVINLGNVYHHCASITQYQGDYWLAFYLGPECMDDQHVVVQRWSPDFRLIETKHLVPKTGNPVLASTDEGLALIYSRFTDVDENGPVSIWADNAVERWKYCNNWLTMLSVDNGRIQSECDTKLAGAHGLLARINPLYMSDQQRLRMGAEGRFLVGMYREKDPLVSIWDLSIKDGRARMQEHSTFGHISEDRVMRSGYVYGKLGAGLAIQPTLMFVDQNLIALCRNVGQRMGDDCRAWLSVFDGRQWSDIRESIIHNRNTSLAIIDYNGDHYLAFTDSRRRSDLWLTNMRTGMAVDLRIPIPGRYSFSYPNLYVDSGANLHVVHTTCGKIAWHTFGYDYLQAVTEPPRVARGVRRYLADSRVKPLTVGDLECQSARRLFDSRPGRTDMEIKR